MKVIVLGAGVIGVTSAWYLRQAGHEVTVVDRQPAAGLETSFANGGQISVSHAEPWANPDAPRQLFKWLGREDAPLLFRPRANLAQWLWGARFLFECLPHRARANMRHIFALARYSADALRMLRRKTGIEYDGLTHGILSFYTDTRSLQRAAATARTLRAWGCVREIKTAGECVAIEPALRHIESRLAGGLFAPDDESGDAHVFTERLAALCAEQGVIFRFSHVVRRLHQAGGSIASVEVVKPHGETDTLVADAYIVALGSYGAALLRDLGIRIPVYPIKGYSVTMPVGPQHLSPSVSLTDEARRLVFSRLGERLRVAGTAELAGYDREINRTRCESIVRRVFELFPEAGERGRARFWTGLRPAMPGNVPVIGGTQYPNLFMNTGHGTLGWTMACGSGRAIVDIMNGVRPEIDFCFSL